MNTSIKRTKDARESIKVGIDKVVDTVKVTIGAKGRNVLISQGHIFSPTITNDGISIAKSIFLPDPFEQAGVLIVRDVATTTNEIAGDGTTTSMVLLQAIINEGLKHIGEGVNVIELKKGIQEATDKVIQALKDMSVPVKTLKEARQVAEISAESQELGHTIADIVYKIGKNGVVTLEESQTVGIESHIAEGMQLDKGYVSPYMSTNLEKLEAEYTDVPVLILDRKIETFADMVPLLDKIIASGKRSLVIFCEDMEGEALTSAILNKTKGVIGIVAVAVSKIDMEDIATLTGGTVVSDESGIKLGEAELSILGMAKKVQSSKNKTVIVAGQTKEVNEKVKQLIAQKELVSDKTRLEDRIARLTGGVAVIKVGAATESDRTYLKLKVEDAVNATKSAMEEGIVIGGGSALIKASRVLGNTVGDRIVKQAIQEPLKQICRNAGMEGDDIYEVLHILNESDAKVGYDVFTNTIQNDMFKAGIIDPVKVTRTALLNSSSAASTFLTTDAALANIEEKDEIKRN